MTEKDPVLSTEHSRWWSSKRSPGGSATSQDAQVEVTLRTGVLVPEVEGSVHPSTGRRAAGDSQLPPAWSCFPHPEVMPWDPQNFASSHKASVGGD